MPDTSIDTTENTFLRLKTLLSTFPPVREKRKNVFEIAGYPNWENVVSNMLSFYFGDGEQHKFGRILFDALLRLLHKKHPTIEIDRMREEGYTVKRERNYIDILIESDTNLTAVAKSWTILIENKIHADLYNDLESYWNTVASDIKIGIVLTINPLSTEKTKMLQELKDKGIIFHNLLHKDLCAEIKSSIPELYDDCDDRHLLYLKDFIHNIDSHYPNPLMEKELNFKLSAFQANAATIDELLKLNNELNNFVGTSVWEAIGPFAFYPYPETTSVQRKHYYYNFEDAINGENQKEAPKHQLCRAFRFYVFQADLFRYGLLTLFFELEGEYTQYIAPLKSLIYQNNLFTMVPDFAEANGGGPDYEYAQIVGVEESDIRMNIEKHGLKNVMQDLLKRNFFQGEQGFVQKCAELLESIINK